MPQQTGSQTAERFYAKVDRNGPTKAHMTTRCWVWLGSRNPDGRGRFWLDGRMDLAYRVAYELEVGQIPPGLSIDHRCHNPGCVNPDHLRPATAKQQAENRSGAYAHCRSGLRGVHWDSAHKKWRGQVWHSGHNYRTGYFTDMLECEKSVIALRNELFEFNDLDRISSAIASVLGVNLEKVGHNG